MSFQYAEADIDGLIDSGTITTLSPGPTYVEYPDTRFETTVHISADGNPVTQASMKDSRTRKWIWARYRPIVPRYEDTFNDLLQLHYKLRLNASKSPWVFLKEDVTENFGKLVYGGGVWSFTADFIRVKVIDVTQNVAPQGGTVIYGTTELTFVIDDAAWNMF